MRAGSLRGAPLARLVSAYYAVHAGPCSVIRIASAWRKKLPTRKCGSAYPNCATCSPECCGAGGTALNTCCIGPSGEDGTNSGPCTATIESADRLCPHSIYNCSTKLQNHCHLAFAQCLDYGFLDVRQVIGVGQNPLIHLSDALLLRAALRITRLARLPWFEVS